MLLSLSLSLSLPFTFFFSFVVRYFPASYFFSSQLCANKENNLKYFFNKLHYGSINILNKFIIFVVFTNEFWTKKVRNSSKKWDKDATNNWKRIGARRRLFVKIHEKNIMNPIQIAYQTYPTPKHKIHNLRVLEHNCGRIIKMGLGYISSIAMAKQIVHENRNIL